MENSPFVRSLPWLLVAAILIAALLGPGVKLLSRLGLL